MHRFYPLESWHWLLQERWMSGFMAGRYSSLDPSRWGISCVPTHPVKSWRPGNSLYTHIHPHLISDHLSLGTGCPWKSECLNSYLKGPDLWTLVHIPHPHTVRLQGPGNSLHTTATIPHSTYDHWSLDPEYIWIHLERSPQRHISGYQIDE